MRMCDWILELYVCLVGSLPFTLSLMVDLSSFMSVLLAPLHLYWVWWLTSQALCLSCWLLYIYTDSDGWPLKLYVCLVGSSTFILSLMVDLSSFMSVLLDPLHLYWVWWLTSQALCLSCWFIYIYTESDGWPLKLYVCLVDSSTFILSLMVDLSSFMSVLLDHLHLHWVWWLTSQALCLSCWILYIYTESDGWPLKLYVCLVRSLTFTLSLMAGLPFFVWLASNWLFFSRFTFSGYSSKHHVFGQPSAHYVCLIGPLNINLFCLNLPLIMFAWLTLLLCLTFRFIHEDSRGWLKKYLN